MKTITANQVRSLQIAAKQVGLRSGKDDGRYKLLLMQYKQPTGKPCQSCKELNQTQYEDFMAICESMGFVHYSGDERHYRDKRESRGDGKSFAQMEAIKAMATDLGWDAAHLQEFCAKMGGVPLTYLSGADAGKVIEALKAMLGRRDKTHYARVSDVAGEYAKVGK